MKKRSKQLLKKLVKNKKAIWVVIAFAVMIGITFPIVCLSGERNTVQTGSSTHKIEQVLNRTVIALEKRMREDIVKETTVQETIQEETKEETEQVYSDEQVEEFFKEEIADEDEEPLPVKQRTLTPVSIAYDGVKRNISCWGDSMTEGFKTTAASIKVGGIKKDISYSTYPSVLQSLNAITTYNLGVSGENSRQIASRQGGWKMYTSENFTISDGKGTFSMVMSQDGDSISLADFSGYNFKSEENHLCMIGDYWGYLVGTGSGYTFTLKESISQPLLEAETETPEDIAAGRETLLQEIIQQETIPQETIQPKKENTVSETLTVSADIFIPAGTQIRTAASIERADDILIIEMGSNGGWKYNYQTLIEQYDAMIESVNCKYYIIIGDTDDPAQDNGEYIGLGDTAWEATLREAYGDHFINMRTYLIENALNDCGLTTDKKDLNAYTKGYLSRKIRSDITHFNAYGYYSKGIAVYKKGVELGYWD